MSGHNTPYHMYQSPLLIADPGDAATITIDRYGAVVPLVSGASAETRTLAQPTKAGILATIVLDTDGGGAVTLTVTGGYNEDAATTMVLADAGDFITFGSISVGSAYYWRVIQREGTAAVAAEHGAGAIGTAVAPVTHRYKVDNNIVTEIKVDLTGLACKGDAAKDAIGLAAGGAAYIGRYVTATCGIVYRVEMSCLETPTEGTATITTDIDLGAEDVGTTAYDGAVDDVVIDTGGVAIGCTYVDDAPALTANDYLYLVEGDTTASTGVYSGGMLIVRLYGHPALS